jgi:hypothetical protein
MSEIWHWAQASIGDSILALSALNGLNRPITLNVTSGCFDVISSLVKIYNLSNFKITIGNDNELENYDKFLNNDGRNWTWDLINQQRNNKTLRYFTPDTISVYNQTFKTNKPDRPCIALATHNGRNGLKFPQFREQQLDILPFNKYYPKEYWQHVKQLVDDAGYDVVIIDSLNTTLEQKIFLLNEFCEALIAYEGGVSHLAHMLKIPTFVLIWPKPLFEGQDIMQEIQNMHFDTKTWFLDSGDELLAWTTSQFMQKIKDLQKDMGNHPINI